MIKNISIDDKNNVITFDFNDTNPRLLNAIRRIIVGAHLECYALDDIIVKVNGTKIQSYVWKQSVEAVRLIQSMCTENMTMKLDIKPVSDFKIIYHSDCQFYDSNELISDKIVAVPNAILGIIAPGETISLNASVSLGVDKHMGYRLHGNFGWEEIKIEDGISRRVTIEALEQIEAKELVLYALDNLEQKLDDILAENKTQGDIGIMNLIQITMLEIDEKLLPVTRVKDEIGYIKLGDSYEKYLKLAVEKIKKKIEICAKNLS